MARDAFKDPFTIEWRDAAQDPNVIAWFHTRRDPQQWRRRS
jgi:hypothetical protein